jgi:arylsulfatase
MKLVPTPGLGLSPTAFCLRAATLGLLLTIHACRPATSTDSRANILLIVADDLGYADLGTYGSDIRTPNIDALAARGVLFTQFHAGPSCAPTRAMLLSGNNNHVAGVGRQSYSGSVPGYEGHLSDRIAPLPEVLRNAGYRTYMAGKWHLGGEAEHSPAAAGFDRSFSLVDGAGAHYSSSGFFEGGSTYREGFEEVDYPEGAYSTELYTDRLIEFIDAGQADDAPFFAVAAYTSPHWPLQVPEAELDRYSGVYDDGYDMLRERRFESLKEAGIVPDASTLPPRNGAITPWADLSGEQKRRESRKMELYAAMVENLDGHVGRLIDHLKATGQYDNTLVVFMSDNGAAGEDFFNVGGYTSYLQSTYDNALENMGRPTSFVSYGEQWAEAGSAPFSRRKTYSREGGLVAPMIVAGPGVAGRASIERAYLTVMDLAPTFIEIAGAEYPATGSVRPMLGESLTGLFGGTASRVHDDDYVTTLFHGGRAYVRQGRWKLVTLDRPFSRDDFELFDILADPGETTNLAEVDPDRYAAMLALWESERERLGIILPDEFQ